MSNSPAISSSEFLDNIKNIVRKDPISVRLSDGTVITVQFMVGYPPAYVLHFDHNEFGGSYRVTEDGEMDYKCFDVSSFCGRLLNREVIDLRNILRELLSLLPAPTMLPS